MHPGRVLPRGDCVVQRAKRPLRTVNDARLTPIERDWETSFEGEVGREGIDVLRSLF